MSISQPQFSGNVLSEGQFSYYWQQMFSQLFRQANNPQDLSSNLIPRTFSSLPTGTLGTMVCISDSTANTWGSTVAGGGTHKVLAWFNGTNWTVIGI